MSRYSTVAIKPVNSRVRGTDILSDTLSDSMVSSIKAELAAKGYTVVEDPEKSDLVVSSIMQEGQTLNPSNAGTRAGQADPFPRRVSNAAFVFYLADRNGKKVWQGDSGPDMPIQSITESRISSIVRSAFDPLPGKPH
jgi:hypothetical protein